MHKNTSFGLFSFIDSGNNFLVAIRESDHYSPITQSLLDLAIGEEHDPGAIWVVSLGDFSLSKEIDLALVWVNLANVAIRIEEASVAIWVLFPLRSITLCHPLVFKDANRSALPFFFAQQAALLVVILPVKIEFVALAAIHVLCSDLILLLLEGLLNFCLFFQRNALLDSGVARCLRAKKLSVILARLRRLSAHSGNLVITGGLGRLARHHLVAVQLLKQICVQLVQSFDSMLREL